MANQGKHQGRNQRRNWAGWLFLIAAFLTVGGCDAMTGRGKQPALYKFPKDVHVVLLVDVREGVTPPPAFASTLADRIGSDLFVNKAIDHLVPQDLLVNLQQKNPDKYKEMHTPELAREVGANVVL